MARITAEDYNRRNLIPPKKSLVFGCLYEEIRMQFQDVKVDEKKYILEHMLKWGRMIREYSMPETKYTEEDFANEVLENAYELEPLDSFFKKLNINNRNVMIINTYPVTMIMQDSAALYYFVATPTMYEPPWYSRDELKEAWKTMDAKEFLSWLKYDEISQSALEVFTEIADDPKTDPISIKEYARPLKIPETSGQILAVFQCFPWDSNVFFFKAKGKKNAYMVVNSVGQKAINGQNGLPVFSASNDRLIYCLYYYIYRFIGAKFIPPGPYSNHRLNIMNGSAQISPAMTEEEFDECADDIMNSRIELKNKTKEKNNG